jgi:3-phosphoshikimate 1-carboxyvinyltransferase
MNWTVQPRGSLRGMVRVPGDKSISHRALLLNALAPGRARLRNLLKADDVDATARVIQAFGCKLSEDGTDTILTTPERLHEPADVLDCGNSGTTIRLSAGIAAGISGLTVLTGDASLRRRPMERILSPLRKMGAIADAREGQLPPVVLRGGALQMIQHTLLVSSAQAKSALLLAGLGPGVAVREPSLSRDHTERMLKKMGANLRKGHDDFLVLLPTDRLTPLDVEVPRDLSAAAFFLVAGSIVAGSEIWLPRVGVNPTRTGVIDALKLMGANIEVQPQELAGAEPVADLVVRPAYLKGIRIQGELSVRCLDELPVLAIAAAFAHGETVIADAAELRVKESDRILRVVTGLRSLGIEVEERPDGMVIQGGRPTGAAVVDSTGDHRIGMAFAVAGCATQGGVTVVGAEAMRTSYPSFADTLEELRD